jgi:hypothetical protein
MAKQKQGGQKQGGQKQGNGQKQGKGFFARVASGLSVISKDFGVTAEGDAGWRSISGGGATHYPGSDIDWEAEAGPLWLNPVVAVCLQFVTDKIAEPHLRAVHEGAGGMLTPVPGHPVPQLLARANPEYNGRQLLAALGLSYKLNGNAYAVKVRGPGGLGAPRELWYVPHWRMRPLTPEDGGPTRFYKLTFPGSTAAKLVPRENVVHMRNGLDPENPRLGMSPFRAQLRGAVSDNEIDTYTAIVLRNWGVFGAIVSPAGADVEVSPDQAEELKRRMQTGGTGDRRGGLIVPNIPIKVDYATRSPKDLALDKMGDRAVQRLCASFGVDPAAVGLAPLTGEKYGTLRKEARASSYEQGILPMLAVFAEAWTQELMPDFGMMPGSGQDAADVWVEYDYTRVRDMQEDADAAHKRAQDDFKAYGLTLDEFRSLIGVGPAEDEALGSRFLFQLLPAPGGDVGVPPAGGEDDAPTEGGDPVVPDEEEEDPDE